MHHLLDRMAVDLGHHVVLAADAIGDAGEELQLVVIAHFGAEDIVQRLTISDRRFFSGSWVLPLPRALAGSRP